MQKNIKTTGFLKKNTAIILILTLIFSMGNTCLFMNVKAEGTGEKTPYNLNSGSYHISDRDFITVSDQILYREKGSTETHPVDENTIIDANKELGISVNFDTGIKTLDDHNYTLTYQMPSSFIVNGNYIGTEKDILIGGVAKGKVVVDEKGLITFTFDRTLLTETTIDAGADVFFSLDLNSIDPSTNTADVSTGSTSWTIKFTPSYLVSNTAINIIKSTPAELVERNGEYFLKYTIKVTPKNNLEKAYVVDTAKLEDSETIFPQDYYDSDFNKITGTEASVSTGTVYMGTTDGNTKPVKSDSSNTMIWELTNLVKDTEYSLTYYTKPKNAYPTNGETTALNNTAEVYTASAEDNDVYLKGDSTATYTPTISAEIKKTVADSYAQLGDDGYYSDYTVKVKNTSGYNLTDLDVFDWMFYRMYDQGYVEYVQDSFKINGEAIPSSRVTIVERYKDPDDSDHILYGYKLCLGPVANEETVTISYRLKIKENLLTDRNGSERFTNNVDARPHNSTQNLSQASVAVNTYKKWARKSHEIVANPSTVNMSGRIYNSSKTQVTSPTSFDTPANAYHYTVLINEDSQYNMSNAVFTDAFEGSNMAYTGYVRVRAYNGTGNIGIIGDDKNANATKYVEENGTLRDTAWYEISDKTTFSFKPKDLDIGGYYAYIIDYYAIPKTTISTTVKNTFKVTGSVGLGTGTYNIKNITTSDSVTIKGSQNCSIVDKPYMYALPGDELAYTDKGSLYWVVKVTGDLVQNMKIYDKIYTGHNVFKDDWLVGVYTGKNNATFPAKNSLSEIISNNNLTEISSYIKEINNTGKANIKLTENLGLNSDEALYMVVKTQLIFNLEEHNNKISGEHWTVDNTAAYAYPNGSETGDVSSSQVFYRNKGLKKIVDGETGVYRFDGTNWTQDKSDGTSSAVSNMAPPSSGQSGIYLAWDIEVNFDGLLSGSATVVDSLPAGLELDTLELTRIGSNLSGKLPQNSEPEWNRTGLTKNNFNEGTIKSSVITGNKYYYDKTSNKVVFAVQNLKQDNETGNNFVEFKALCKVTDMNLLNVKDVAKFSNIATMYSDIGKTIRTADITFYADSLSKEGDETKAKRSGIYHFVINANPLGLDLIKNSNTVVVCDKLGPSLTFKEKTVVIKNENGTVLSSDRYSVNVEEQTDGSNIVKFTVPDETKLTIEYDTKVNIPAGSDSVSISNTAYWEGQEPSNDSSVNIPQFKMDMNTRGDGTTANGKLNVTLKDTESKPIKNAEFEIYSVTVDKDNNKVETLVTSVTTDNNGKLTVNNLDFNQVYEIKQKTTTDNYIVDEHPQYIAIPNSYGQYNESFNSFIDDLVILTDNGVTVECEYESYTSEVEFINEIRYGEIIGATLFIENKIGVNFYVYMGGKAVPNGDRHMLQNFDKEIASKYEMHFRFKDMNGNYIDEQGNPVAVENAFTEIKPFSENEINFLDVNGEVMPLFRFTHWCYAFEMADTIEACMYKKTSSGTVQVTKKPIKYSIKSYAKNMLNSGEEALDNLLIPMLNYGAYSQKYWNHNTSNLANAGYELDVPDTTINSKYQAVKSGTASSVSVDQLQLKFNEGASFDITATVNVAKGHTLGDFKTKLSSDTIKSIAKEGSLTSLPYDLSDDFESTPYEGQYTLTLENIPVYRWDDKFTLTFTGDSTYSVTFSLLSYAYQVANNSSSYEERLVNLLKSMYLYNEKAQAYFADVEEFENDHGIPDHGAGSYK